MNTDHLCSGCVSDGGTEARCPHCWYQETDGDVLARSLPLRVVLNDKYLIDRALGGGGFGVTCLAWDMNPEIEVAIEEYMPLDIGGRTSQHTIVSDYSGKGEPFRYGAEKFIEEVNGCLERCARHRHAPSGRGAGQYLYQPQRPSAHFHFGAVNHRQPDAPGFSLRIFGLPNGRHGPVIALFFAYSCFVTMIVVALLRDRVEKRNRQLPPAR